MAEQDIQVRIQLAIEASESAKTIGETKKALKDLKSLGQEVGDVNTKEFQKIAEAVGDVNDRVGDMNQSFKSLSGEPIENVASSFGALKQSIMSLDLKSAKAAFNNLSTSISAMGKVILQNPLFLLAAVIAGVVYALYQLKDAGGVVTQIFEAVGEVIDGVIQYLKDLADAWGLSAFAAKKAAQDTEDALARQREAIESNYDLQIEKAQAAGKETFELEKEKNKKLLENNQKEIDAFNKKVGFMRQRTEEEKKQYDELLKARIKYQNAVDVLDVKEDKYQKDKRKESKEKAKKDAEKELKEKKELYKRLNSVKLQSLEEVMAKEKEIKDKAQAEYDQKELDALVKQAQITAQRIGSVNAQVDAEIMARNRLLQNEQLTATERENIVRESEDKIKQIKDTSAEQDKERDKQAMQSKLDEASNILQIASTLANAIQNIANLVAENDSRRKSKDVKERNKAAKKAFITQKSLGIVMAGINTAAAVISALGTAPTIIAGIAMAAAAGIAGAAQIGVIAAKKFNPEQPASSSPSTPLPSMSMAAPAAAAATPAFTSPTFFGLGKNNLLNQTNGVDNRVYVVESDITNSQRRVRTTQGRSELGG